VNGQSSINDACVERRLLTWSLRFIGRTANSPTKFRVEKSRGHNRTLAPSTVPATIPDSMMMCSTGRATGVFADDPYPFVVHSASIPVTSRSVRHPPRSHPTYIPPRTPIHPAFSQTAPTHHGRQTLPGMSICTSLPHVPTESIVYALRSAAWDDATSSCPSTHATPGRPRFRGPIFSMALPTNPPSFIGRDP
jgi:hypothetical protein